MKYQFFIITLFFNGIAFAQSSTATVDVTPGMQKEMKEKIEKEIPALRQQLIKEKVNPVEIEFTIDTFRVEKFFDKLVSIVCKDFEMRDAAYEAARIYDSHLNKYYKKLLSVLKDNDKKKLIQAQRAWINFRDNEMILIETISKDAYAGGGTMQQLTESSKYLYLMKSRNIEIFNHFTRAIQVE